MLGYTLQVRVSIFKLHCSLHMKLIYQSVMIYASQLIICESTLHNYYLLHINIAIVTANDVWNDLILMISKISINKKTVENLSVNYT